MRSWITGGTGRVGSVLIEDVASYPAWPVEPEQAQRRAAETLLQRVGSPDDVADPVIYLAGAEFVTGTSLVVDGGRLLQSGIGERP